MSRAQLTKKLPSSLNLLSFPSLLWAVLGVLLAVILYWSLNKGFDHDELEVVHSAWKISQGEKIYVDFFQHHHPLLYYLLAPIIPWLGETAATLVVYRIIFFGLYLGILLVTYLLATQIFTSVTGIISLLLLSTSLMFTTNGIELRPDVPQTLLSLLSLLLLFIYVEQKQIKYLVGSAIAVGIAFLFLQKAIFFMGLSVLALLAFSLRQRMGLTGILVYLGGAFLPWGVYLLTLTLSGDLEPYFLLNWALNIQFIDRAYPVETLINAIRNNTFLWAFFVIGLFYLKTSEQKIFGLIGLGIFLAIFSTRKAHQQYFIALIPLVSILAAQGIYTLFYPNKKLISVILAFALLYPSYFLIDEASNINNQSQLQKINYVLDITQPRDYVYDGDIMFNVFRKDIDFFWYSLDQKDGLETYQRLRPYPYDIYQLISRYQPKVISNYFIKNMDDARIKRHYIQSERYPDIFIRVDSL